VTDLFDRYETLMSQALKELDAGDVAADATAAERATVLGDAVYRLSVEHGLPYNPFRETVIAALSGVAPVTVGRDGGRREPFAAALAKDHGLLLLALEMMPADE